MFISYSSLTLSIHDGMADLKQARDFIVSRNPRLEPSDFEIDAERNTLNAYDLPWNNHDEDILEFSKMHPGVVFKLHGESDSLEDNWDAYYKDGLYQQCFVQISYAPYDESKLDTYPNSQDEDDAQYLDEDAVVDTMEETFRTGGNIDAMLEDLKKYHGIEIINPMAPGINLWLDDDKTNRKPPTIMQCGLEWTWVHTADEAIDLMRTGRVVYASLDHDLADEHYFAFHCAEHGHSESYEKCKEKTGYDVLLWMEENNVWPVNGVRIHTMNPPRKRIMLDLVEKYYGRTFQEQYLGTHKV